MPEFEFKSATDRDFDTFFNLFEEIQSLHQKHRPEYFRKPQKNNELTAFFGQITNDPNQHLRFAYVNNNAEGYVHFQIIERTGDVFSYPRRHGLIHQIVVTQKSRNLGCASALIEHTKKQVAKQGIKELAIDHWSFNVAARNCFRKSGFKLLRENMVLSL